MSKIAAPIATMTDVLCGGPPPCAPTTGKGVRYSVASVIDTVVNLAKRRGFVFPAGEIYGGTKSAWDYGPLGVELKENIKRQWWRSVVTGRDDVVGLDSSIILPRQVWVASGHVEVFNDPLVESLITPQALSRRPSHRSLRSQAWAAAAQRAGRHPRPRDRRPRPVDRAARVQHDAQDVPRTHRDGGGDALSAP